MTLNAYLPDTAPPFDLVEHFIAKKTYYPAAINRVLDVLDRGYKHRVTYNGEIGRNYDDLRDRWRDIQYQMQKMDDALKNLGTEDNVGDMSRRMKGLSIVTEARPRSAGSTSSTTTLTHGGVSPTAQTSSQGSSIQSRTRVTSLPPRRRESLLATPTPRHRSVSTTTSSSSRSSRLHIPLFPRSRTPNGRPQSVIGTGTGGLIPIEARPRWNASPIANILGGSPQQKSPPKVPAVVVTPSRIPRSGRATPGSTITPTKQIPQPTPPSSTSPTKRIPTSIGRGTSTPSARLSRMVSNPNLPRSPVVDPPPAVPKVPDVQSRRQTANFSNISPPKARSSGIPRPSTAQGMRSGTGLPQPKWRG
jgi:hypothetical protein